MKKSSKSLQPSASQTGSPELGLKVRTDLRAGAWNCANCQGEVTGNQLFKPTCEYCQTA